MAAAFAQTPDLMHQGLDMLRQEKFADAQAIFERVIKQSPSSVQAHYCLAVCYHHQGSYAAAVKEYSWVCKNTAQPDLVRRCRKGWAACYEANQTSGPPIANTMTAANAPAFTIQSPGESSQMIQPAESESLDSAVAKTPGAAAANSPAPAAVPSASAASIGTSGMPRIVDVYTDWCGWCKKFEPNFEKARAKHTSIEFVRINAEAPGNQSFCKSLNIHGYPTIVMLDGNGKALNIIEGCPESYESFEKEVSATFPGQ
jgi:thioredoxin-like negative regulator of GroEL